MNCSFSFYVKNDTIGHRDCFSCRKLPQVPSTTCQGLQQKGQKTPAVRRMKLKDKALKSPLEIYHLQWSTRN